MILSLDTIGSYIGRTAEQHPKLSRACLRAAFTADLWYKRVHHIRGLSHAKQYLKCICEKNIIKALACPDKSVMVSLFVPCEPLIAMGLNGFSVESFSSYITGAHAQQSFLEKAESAGIPETMCSYHKVFLGAAQLGVMPKPRYIIHTNIACDANQITFRELAVYFGVPHFKIDVPYRQNEEAVTYVAGQLRDMTKFIEAQEHRTLTDDMLRETVARSARTAANYDNLLTRSADRYLAGDLTAELQATFISHMLLGTKEAEKYTGMAVREIQKEPSGSAINILWLHTIPYRSPHINERLSNNPNIHITTCDMAYESLIPADAGNPYESMARRLVYSPFNGPIERRIETALQKAEQIHAAGVVYFCHWGCKATVGGAAIVKKELEEAGYPTLILDGDACDPRNTSEGQITTRMDAFIELLEQRRNQLRRSAESTELI
jgi:benzoyl-CoA reductase/2-hydroxyglutaryl-CoA dehydratase subunit BcrC/BadD/HgdB